ncbi:MAG: cell division protein FtsL [Treponema sp.]|jgi:cell division protein FtsL|nr:cell division protein FtsL [Treponema sp.]
MKKNYLLLFFIVVTIPLLLGLCALHSVYYLSLKREVTQLEAGQLKVVEQNKQLITGIAVLSKPERIDKAAKNILGLRKISPDDVLLVRIEEGGKGHGL